MPKRIIDTTFGVCLHQLRVRGRLSMNELARRTGLNVAALWRLEHGDYQPAWDTVVRLAVEFDVPADTFRGRGVCAPVVTDHGP